jgi:hypothetical protein
MPIGNRYLAVTVYFAILLFLSLLLFEECQSIFSSEMTFIEVSEEMQIIKESSDDVYSLHRIDSSSQSIVQLQINTLVPKTVTESAVTNLENIMIFDDPEISTTFFEEFKRVHKISKPLKIKA